jgi:cysteine desulfuration protein SufE
MTLTELRDDWQDLEPAERLEELLEWADQLPPLPPDLEQSPFPPECRVQECQTPVHLWVSVEEGRVRLRAAVPRQSPTVRGLVSLAWQMIDGRPVAEVLSLPDDWVSWLGLSEALGMTRQQGFRGVIAAIKRETRRKIPG